MRPPADSPHPSLPAGSATRAPWRVLVIDGPASDYLEGLEVERSVFDEDAVVELCRVREDSEIDGRLEAADVVISWHAVPLRAASFARMKRCRGVVRAAVGYDNIDIAAARGVGIPVANVPDYGTEEVADHTIALLLASLRRLRATDAAARAGTWDWRAAGSVSRLRGLRLGLVGFGRIGMAVAQRSRVFGLRCSFHDPFVRTGIEKSLDVERAETLLELAGRSDVLSIHTPSSAATRGLIGARELAALPGNALLVNTARGDVIDQAALIAHLEAQPEFRAALDVLAEEPQVPPALRASPQVLLTCHSAFYSGPSLAEMRQKSARTARRLAEGGAVATIVNGHPAGDTVT